MASFAEFPFSTTEQMNLNNSHMIPLASVDKYPAGQYRRYSEITKPAQNVQHVYI